MDLEGDWSSRLRELFDGYALREWERLDADARGRASFEIHRRFLRRFVEPGMRVLEVGSGPGRFTLELARLGCRIVVTDISPVQLALNEDQVRDASLGAAVEEWRELDVCDLSSVAADEFDAVVAYGGPLSYAFERAEQALGEMLRVTRSGGAVVASVMALAGTLRFFLAAVPEYSAIGRLEILRRVVETGDNRYDPPMHPCRMFYWREIEEMVRRTPGHLVGASASNFLTCGDQNTVEAIASQPELWELLLDWEERMSAEPGVLDGGTRLLFAVRSS